MMKRLLLALAASFTICMSAHATSVLPLYLDEIVDSAAVAFEGTVVSNRTTRDDASGFVVTYTTFRVHEALKGNPGETVTIKQVGGELPAEGIREKAYGVPRFTAGQSVVLFLYGTSQAGFSSPVGLDQGRFMISNEPNGPEVTNGRDFRDMAQRMSDTAPAGAKERLGSANPVKNLGLDDFKKMVRDHAASRGTRSGQ
jgi:hypothetical protein